MTKYTLTIALCLLGIVAIAQTAPQAAEASQGLGATDIMVILMLGFMLLLVVSSFLLLRVIKLVYVEKTAPGTPLPVAKKHWEDVEERGPSVWEKMLSLKPIAQEKDIELPHTYDDIKELDNPVPRWFNVLFYGTIIFGAFYIFIYEFSGIGAPQHEEYVQEVQKADAEKLAALKSAGAVIDENTVVLDQSAAVIANGKAVYESACVACHGDKGQGLVGPNLTDAYWLHGGGIQNVFKVIKYGVPEKGMVAWGKTMSAKNIADIANYIISMKGTNPANAKAAQGTEYVEGKEAVKTDNENGTK